MAGILQRQVVIEIATTSSDRTARIFDVETGQEIARILEDCTAVSFSPNGKILATATGYFNGSIDLWDTTTNRKITGIINDRYLQCAAISPDTKLIVTAGLDSVGPGGQSGTARILDTDTGNKLDDVGFGDFVLDIKFSSDGKYLALAAYEKGIINTSTGNNIVPIFNQEFIEKIFFNPNGSHLVGINEYDNNLHIWSTGT